jgi:hypothetical protein
MNLFRFADLTTEDDGCWFCSHCVDDDKIPEYWQFIDEKVARMTEDECSCCKANPETFTE